MAHAHHHDARSSYYQEQLWTIGTCGAIGIVMILLWWYGVLGMFLDPKFHGPVLWGGIGLLVLVVIRAIALWQAVGGGAAESAHGCCHEEGTGHDHVHGAGCDHDHGAEPEHAHEHPSEDMVEQAVATEPENEPEAAAGDHADCGHDHGWAPWRYAVLLLPVVLFLMRLPWPDPPDQPEQANVIPLKLAEAEQAAESEASRMDWRQRMETNSVRLKGKVETPWTGDRRFGFVRLRMTCCYADAYGEPVKVMVDSPKPLDLAKLRGNWVKVIGKLDFLPTANQAGFVSVVRAESIKQIDTPANQFDN